MKFSLWTQYGALNSVPVFEALKQGLSKPGHEIVENNINADVAVLWSVLWKGRMAGNHRIYHYYTAKRKPVLIVEVGSLIRNHTWKLSFNNVNSAGYFGNFDNLDNTRPTKLGIELKPYNENRREEILIAGQQEQSLQWQGQPTTKIWLDDLVSKIRQHTDRKILFRPHPRSFVSVNHKDIAIVRPNKIQGTYDDYDYNSAYHCVVNHNSGPGVQAAINGTPVIVDSTSLAHPVSDTLANIDNPTLLDRSEWFVKLCHTEWTREEIAQGIPLIRLLPYLESKTH
jgi:hypothetical protein